MALLAGKRIASPGWLSALAPELAVLSVVVIWSSTWVIMKDALAVFDPTAFMAGRFLLISALAWGVVLWRGRGDGELTRVARADRTPLVVGALTGYTAYQVCSVIALDNSSVFTLSLLIALVPLFTMLMQSFRGEAIPIFGWPGLAIAVAGAVLFLADKRTDGDTFLGIVLSLGAAVAFAVYGLVNRRFAGRYPSATLTAWQVAIGTVPMLAIGIPALASQDWSGIPTRVWLGLGFVVVFPVYVAYQLWNYAIRHRGAARTASFALLVPILSGVQAAVAFGEQISLVKAAGAALVVCGLLLIRLDRRPWTTRVPT